MQRPQKLSRCTPGIAFGDLSGEVLAARIYFGTDEWRLGSDDRAALVRLADQLRPWLRERGTVAVRCEGHADARADVGHNERLSRLRAEQASKALEELLALHPGLTMMPEVAWGESRSGAFAKIYDEDRRVDVFVRVTPRWEIDARTNPAVGTRVSIFRKFSPVYHLWKERALEYLVEEYERNDQDEVSMRVRPADRAKVLDLTLALAKLRRDPERGRLGLLRGDSEIGSAYEVEYRNAYRDAYARYEEAFFKCWNGSPGLSADQVRQVVLDARK
jgi:hypothetical protein